LVGGLAAVALALAPAAALGWAERVVRESPRGSVAACLRSAGDGRTIGMLAPLERRMSPYDLFRVDGGGLEPAGQVRLGNLEDCPGIAGNSGLIAIAGIAGDPFERARARVALAGPGGLTAPVTLGDATNPWSVTPDVAVSSSGDVLVVWSQARRRPGSRRWQERVVASRRPAGGEFSAPVAVSAWGRPAGTLDKLFAATVDRDGNAAVVWARAARRKGRFPSSTVHITSVDRGGEFGAPLQLGRSAAGVSQMSIASAAGGRLLIAHDSIDGVRVYERDSLGGAVRRAELPDAPGDSSSSPDVAMRDDGSALVAWEPDGHSGGGAAIATRNAIGAFGPTTRVAAPRDDALGEGFAIIRSGPVPTAPLDEANRRVRVALGDDGRFVLAWTTPWRLPFRDRPRGARVVTGTLAGGSEEPVRLGCPCRNANGVAPLFAGGRAALAFSDNRPHGVQFVLEDSSPPGRLHLAFAADPAPLPPPAPELKVVASPQVLRWRDPLIVRAHCDRACDLRAAAAPPRGRGSRLRALGAASLRRPGWIKLRLRAGDIEQVAPRRRGRMRVSVRAYAPNSESFSARTIRVRVSRHRVRPLPPPRDVQARRFGRRIVVTWLYQRMPSVSFFIEGRRYRNRPSLSRRLWSFRYARHKHFRAVLHARPQDRVRFVQVTAQTFAPPRKRSVLVRVRPGR
jgi:hypothetical protein